MRKKQTMKSDRIQKQEFMMFISCLEPRSVSQIGKLWGYSESSIYGKFDKLVDDDVLKVDKEERKGNFTEKFYITNFNNFFSYLENNSFPLFQKHAEALKEFYSKNKEILSAEILEEIFNYPNAVLDEFPRKLPNELGIRNYVNRIELAKKGEKQLTRYLAYHYFDIVIPVLLYFLPICVKIIQYRKSKYPLNPIMSVVLLIAPKFAKYPSGSWRTKSIVSINLIKRGLFLLSEKFMKNEFPNDMTKKLYKDAKNAISGLGSADIELNLFTRQERQIALERLDAKKYDIFELFFC